MCSSDSLITIIRKIYLRVVSSVQFRFVSHDDSENTSEGSKQYGVCSSDSLVTMIQKIYLRIISSMQFRFVSHDNSENISEGSK